MTRDVRAKLTIKSGASMEGVFPGYEAGPMKYIKKDRGVIFPYVPTLMMGHQANWGNHQPTHSNFSYKFFTNYSLQDFTVTGVFTASTAQEGRYMEGAMHFFKSAMKIGFGEFDDHRGVPPPVLEFSVWGPAIAKRIPCVIGTFSYNIDGGTDYVWPISSGLEPTTDDSMVPLQVTFIINLSPTYSTRSTRKTYTSKDFYNGKLLKQGYL
tara:strand:- start:1727 stop:2356 length:630 start_codon:yes stop_codon:yes gene_type:complete